MKRTLPFTSPLGFALTGILLLGLGLAVWTQGGLAFSPGSVSAQDRAGQMPGGFASHAAFETECGRCHQPLKTIQADLCVGCHSSISGEINRRDGIHGKIASIQDCAGCHSDHHGRDYNLHTRALAKFDHSMARFNLVWHQVDYDAAPMSCRNCHVEDAPGLNTAVTNCISCHSAHQPDFMQEHVLKAGKSCLDCHDGLDRMTRFDHTTTAFALDGKHTQATCFECHSRPQQPGQTEQPFQNTSPECSTCHPEPALHAGIFPPGCQQCHTTDDWRPATLDGVSFDHEENTTFSLVRHAQDYSKRNLTCAACHPSGVQTFAPETCTACHASNDPGFIQQHTEQVGPACLACHDGVDRMRGFDHARVFPLEDRHAQIGCQDCHIDFTFQDTPGECVECHAEPEIHTGFFGLECGNCHTSQAWTPAFLQAHGFPLDHGGQGRISCETCHPSRYVEYTCYGCHDHQPEAIAESHANVDLSSISLKDCTQCHPEGFR